MINTRKNGFKAFTLIFILFSVKISYFNDAWLFIVGTIKQESTYKSKYKLNVSVFIPMWLQYSELILKYERVLGNLLKKQLT